MSVGDHLVVEHRARLFLFASLAVGPRRLAQSLPPLLIAVIITTVAIAHLHEKVTNWLGIGHTRIVKVEGGVDTTGLPSLQDQLSADLSTTNRDHVGHSLPTIEALGDLPTSCWWSACTNAG